MTHLLPCKTYVRTCEKKKGLTEAGASSAVWGERAEYCYCELSGRSPAVQFGWAEVSKVVPANRAHSFPAPLPDPLSFSQLFQRGASSANSDHDRGWYRVGGTAE